MEYHEFLTYLFDRPRGQRRLAVELGVAIDEAHRALTPRGHRHLSTARAAVPGAGWEMISCRVSEASDPGPVTDGLTRSTAGRTTRHRALPSPRPPVGTRTPGGSRRWRWWDGRTWTGYTDQFYAPLPVASRAVDPTTADRSGPAGPRSWAWSGASPSRSRLRRLRLVGVVRQQSPARAVMQLGLWTGLLGACVWRSAATGPAGLRDLGRGCVVDPPLGIGFGLATLIGVGIIVRRDHGHRHRAAPRESREPMHRNALTVAVVLFIAVVGAPFVEELFFRGCS